MVNIKSEENGCTCRTDIKMKDTVVQMTAELGTAINQMYRILKNTDKSDAALFRMLMIALVNNKRSPMWDVAPDIVPGDKTKTVGDMLEDLLRKGQLKNIITLLEEMEA